MALKKDKQKEMMVAEHDHDSSDLFWKILESNLLGIAVTDEVGDINFSNELFLRKLIETDCPLDTKITLKDLATKENESNENHKLIFNNGKENIRVNIFKTGLTFSQYLWIISDSERKPIVHSVSIKNLYRSFLETTFELIFKSSANGKIVYSNQLFLKNFGFECAKKIRGQDIRVLFENESQYFALEERLKTETKIEGEVVLFRKADGSRLTGMVNCKLSVDHRGANVFNWIVLDISRQVESESILKSKNEQLAKVNHQMEKFLYSTSHDLRSPITSILGLINLVRLDSKDQAALSYIQKIEVCTLKLDKIIRDIMSFSRATYQHESSERTDLELLIWRIINGQMTESQARRIHFDVQCNGVIPFFGDANRLEIVIENIIRNSIHFYDVNKSRPFVRVSVTVDNEKASLEFMDNGIGIGKQHLSEIFNMFYKASHLSKGAGLGLYIVKETLQKLKGSISVESEIGFGTVFRVVVPNDKKAKLIGRKLQLQHNS
ncbi:MAG TPA: hypothetical protein DGG95_02970 [Cytophagales bacterium]|nr:hypothetical protein [Cytophagales bacterium]